MKFKVPPDQGYPEQPPALKMDTDCVGCRLISGSGLIGAAAYIAHHSMKSNHKLGRIFMQVASIGFASAGSARLLNVYPFNITHKS